MPQDARPPPGISRHPLRHDRDVWRGTALQDEAKLTRSGGPLSYPCRRRSGFFSIVAMMLPARIEIEPHFAEEAKRRMLSGVRANPKEIVPQGQSRDQAAAAVGAS
jgi:hypothetical protein